MPPIKDQEREATTDKTDRTDQEQEQFKKLEALFLDTTLSESSSVLSLP
jgi:hypothetical protein